tara:strand:- start:2649 stop:2795 length:147 start_codon:yes stop_codon:yes gene_type:complete
MAEVKHRLGIGKTGDNINNDFISLDVAGFTFDSTKIKFDSTINRFDEL